MREAIDVLQMWVVYRSPRDVPGKFVARLWQVRAYAEPAATTQTIIADTLSDVRARLPGGLSRLPRDVNDEPQIIEMWL